MFSGSHNYPSPFNVNRRRGILQLMSDKNIILCNKEATMQAYFHSSSLPMIETNELFKWYTVYDSNGTYLSSKLYLYARRPYSFAISLCLPLRRFFCFDFPWLEDLWDLNCFGFPWNVISPIKFNFLGDLVGRFRDDLIWFISLKKSHSSSDTVASPSTLGIATSMSMGLTSKLIKSVDESLAFFRHVSTKIRWQLINSYGQCHKVRLMFLLLTHMRISLLSNTAI